MSEALSSFVEYSSYMFNGFIKSIPLLCFFIVDAALILRFNYQFDGTTLTFQGSGSSSSTTYKIIEGKDFINLEVEGSIYNIIKWRVIKENPNLLHLIGEFTFAYPGPHYANGTEIADQTLMRATLIKQ
ncbi:MAG: hypothetical protein V4546_09000 [Bacteroidota bacterium]